MKTTETSKNALTTDPVQPGGSTNAEQEFGRLADVHRTFGLKRGTVYNLLRDGKIKGCLLRVRGAKSGVRLFHMASVRGYICEQMGAGATAKNGGAE